MASYDGEQRRRVSEDGLPLELINPIRSTRNAVDIRTYPMLMHVLGATL